MKVHIKALTLLVVGVLVINSLFFGVSVSAAAAPSIGIPVGFEMPLFNLPENIYKGFKDAYNMFINDIFGMSNSYSYTDYDGSTKTAYAETVKAQGLSIINSGGVMYDANEDGVISLVYYDESTQNNYFVDLTLEQYSIFLSTVQIEVDVDTYNGENVVSYYYSMPTYDSSIKSVLNGIISEDDHSSIAWDMKHIHGVPQNELTINQDFIVSVFDSLGLSYKAFSSIDDVLIEVPSINGERIPAQHYTPFFITSDNELYVYEGRFYQFSQNTSYGYCNYFYLYYGNNDVCSPYRNVSQKAYLSGRLYSKDGHLYFCILDNFILSGQAYFRQTILGSPKLSTYPILFTDRSDYLASLSGLSQFNKNTDLNNVNFSFSFLKAGFNESITDEELLSKDIVLSGYFAGSNGLYNSSTVTSAGQMLSGTENAISGGGQTTISSELSDWQKAIYILAQQQGTTYEELLEKLDMIIDAQGNISIVGVDGIEYSISALSKSFDEIYSKVENISGDLSELLEYLKSLNMESLESYISALEGTLNDLNERDKDQTAVLGGMSDTLNDLSSQLDNADLSGMSANISSINSSITQVTNDLQSQKLMFDEIFSNYLSGTDLHFNLYDQCKFFLEKLFNFSDRNTPPNFSFYYDSNGDGEAEIYPLIDFSFLETTLTNENTVDKSLWATPIKVIDVIRYIIAIVCYGLFVMRLLKRLPTFYGNGPLSFT